MSAILLSGLIDDERTVSVNGAAPPVILQIGTADVPGRDAAFQIEEFARHVDTLSNGQLHIDPVWQAAGAEQDDSDQAVAQLVVSGELEMGLIPSRSWDTEGVTSLRALNAPFLVTSDSLLDIVVADELASEMLRGLDTVGVTGLALLPEGLRHVFAFGTPMLSPSDFNGATIRVPTSDTTNALFEALGANPDDFGGVGDRFAVGVVDGTIAAAESSFALAGSLPLASTATGNVTLYPKVNVIVVNTAALGGLGEPHRQILRDAAVATRGWAIATNRDDHELAQEFCAIGGRIVLASEADVAALQQATSVVYQELERDQATATAITEMRVLAESVGPPPPIEECGTEQEAVTTDFAVEIPVPATLVSTSDVSVGASGGGESGPFPSLPTEPSLSTVPLPQPPEQLPTEPPLETEVAQAPEPVPAEPPMPTDVASGADGSDES